MKKLNYFQYHDSLIWDKRREILEKVIFHDDNTLEVYRHELLVDNQSFISYKKTGSWKFICKKKLYISKEKCLKQKKNVYLPMQSNKNERNKYKITK